MVNVAIVEDDDNAAKLLESYLKNYEKKQSISFNIKRFSDAVSFLTDYRKVYDIIFMDIEMPDLNGLDAALKLRVFDKEAVLIFVTNMAQFAVKGYEADALDFMIKPINYQDFVLKLKKAISIVSSNAEVQIVVAQVSGFTRLSTKKISYIEVMGHKLNYHTDSEIVSGTGSLSKLEEKLKAYNFMRCNNCYLVNPKFILSVQGYTINMLGGEKLQISIPKKKKFMMELTDWLGQGNYI